MLMIFCSTNKSELSIISKRSKIYDSDLSNTWFNLTSFLEIHLSKIERLTLYCVYVFLLAVAYRLRDILSWERVTILLLRKSSCQFLFSVLFFKCHQQQPNNTTSRRSTKTNFLFFEKLNLRILISFCACQVANITSIQHYDAKRK